MEIIAYLIIFFGVINLLRLTLLLIGSDLYGLSNFKKYRKVKIQNYPKISVVIPAFNEEQTVLRSIRSVLANDYPKDKVEVLVVDDGSTDRTFEKVQQYILAHGLTDKILLVSQQNSGKALALNKGMKEYATGSLVMCLDADSSLDKYALKNTIKYFEEDNVMAVASNVKIMKGKGLLNLVQKMEYLVCYQMKRAQTFYNIEYIVGGIGSVFRKNHLQDIQFYDANTVTEDIDITMKILREGNRRVKVLYASDVIAFTPSVLTIKDLLKQRYRWKWGRYQTFLKNSNMFFSRNKAHTKGLTWLYLPFALFSEAGFLLEPFFIAYILFISFYFQSFFTILSAFLILTFYLIMNILAEDTLPWRNKIRFIALAPAMYILFYILTFVEYFVLVKAIFNSPKLKESLNISGYTWQPVKRSSNNFAIEYSTSSPQAP